MADVDGQKGEIAPLFIPASGSSSTLFKSHNTECTNLTHHNAFYAMTFLTKQAVIKIMKVRRKINDSSSENIISLNPEVVWLSLANIGGWEQDAIDPSISKKYVGMVITLEDYMTVSRKAKDRYEDKSKIRYGNKRRNSISIERNNNNLRPKRDIYIPSHQRERKKNRDLEEYHQFIHKFISSYSHAFKKTGICDAPEYTSTNIEEYYEIMWREIETNDWHLWCEIR